MTTLKALTSSKPNEYMMIYESPSKEENFESFFRPLVKSSVKVYSAPHRQSMLYETFGTLSIGDLDIINKLHQTKERSKPIQESLSTLKPEIVGLGLGGILSLGLSIFALSIHNIGLATVMAGPFFASLLGFALLLTGLKRKGNEGL